MKIALFGGALFEVTTLLLEFTTSYNLTFSEFEEAILTFFDDYKKDKEKELEDMKEK